MAWLGEDLPKDQQNGATPFAPRTNKDIIEEELFAQRRDLFSSLDMVFAKANEFGFDVHSSHIHPSLGLRSQPANCLCSAGQSIGGTAREVKSVTMAENVVPFPVVPEPERSRPTCTKRIMLTIGTKRYALEFSSTVMEVNPADAPVIPIQHRKPGRRPKSS